MPCYNPLKAWDHGYDSSGKHIIEFVKYAPKIDMLDREKNIIDIPCGKCLGCRLDYAKQWSDRCMMEASMHEHNWFVTLTYDDDHLPGKLVNLETGEISDFDSVCKEDVQLFFKRLRQALVRKYEKEKYPFLECMRKQHKKDWRVFWASVDLDQYKHYKNNIPRIRYFGCAEYGPSTYRPHYHMIIFGLELDDLVPAKKKNFQGYQYFNSKLISDTWDKGNPDFQIITKVTPECCNYVARYVLKKVVGDKRLYSTLCLHPEFTFMSRRPGIGSEYYKQNKDKIYKYDKVILPTQEKGIKFKPPRYFDKLFDVDYPNEMRKIKERRKENGYNSSIVQLNSTSMSKKDMLESSCINKEQKTNILKRKEVFP